jgi:hypothetical protein
MAQLETDTRKQGRKGATQAGVEEEGQAALAAADYAQAAVRLVNNNL